ncbi:MAG TPA: SCO family protein [Rudaea sp.]|jgi:protein SCO1/2|uniref:SCO family protein n=1 Tax=Rudaea sp. TaxID=2136325 RepID=UPI002F92FD69
MPILRTLLASLALILVGGAALAAATGRFRAFTTETARRIEVREHPLELPAVALETAAGTRINLSDLRGKWLLVDFIYTRCPTYCVALGGEFAQLQDRLAGPLAQGKVQLLSISFDPDRDTPQRLATYLKLFRDRGEGWLAARPIDPQGLARLEQAFGITVIADTFGGYTHNVAIHVVDPRGRLVEILDVGNPDLVAQAVLQRTSP